MSEVRCPCGFGRLEECERFGHAQGSQLDHERALRNLDRASKRIRKFKRAMMNFFPHINASETDNAIRAIYDETRNLRYRIETLEISLRRAREGVTSSASNIDSLPVVSLPVGWNSLAGLVCENCGEVATNYDNTGIPLCRSCWADIPLVVTPP
jgi:hypothetical protein